MAKDERKGEAAQGQPQQMTPPQIDDTEAKPSYSNYCRVTSTPEELILDFCLTTSPQPGAQPAALQVKERLVMSFYTAKRLLGALSMAVQRHEQAFGVLETDVTKRVRPQAAPAGGQQAN